MTQAIETDIPAKEEVPGELSAATPADQVTLLDILIVLAKHKRLIAQITIGATLAALAISFIIPKKFTASTRILPPQQTQSSAVAMLAQLNPLATQRYF